MFSMFSPDSKIMQVLARLSDLVILNFLYLITCIPVFTIGAANTALYSVCFRMLREEGGVVKPYFRAFRDNFRQGTGIWLILLLFSAIGILNLNRYYTVSGVKIADEQYTLHAGGLPTTDIEGLVYYYPTPVLASGQRTAYNTYCKAH